MEKTPKEQRTPRVKKQQPQKKPAGQQQPRKPAQQKRRSPMPQKTHDGEIYSSSSLVSIIHGNQDDFTTPLAISLNPLVVAEEAKDPILNMKCMSYNCFKVLSAKLELKAVCGPNAAVGTTATVGSWQNVDDPTGPQTPNTALKMDRAVTVGIGMRACAPIKHSDEVKVVYTEATAAPRTWNPGHAIVSLIGQTGTVYNQEQTPVWKRPLWHAFLHYTYHFTSPKDNRNRGSLAAGDLDDQKVSLHEIPDEPLVLEMPNSPAARKLICRGRKAQGRGRAGLWDFASGILQGLSGVLPPPWGSLLNAGVALVRPKTATTREGDTIQLELFQTLSDVAQDQPVMGVEARTTQMDLINGHYTQMTDPGANSVLEDSDGGGGVLPPTGGGIVWHDANPDDWSGDEQIIVNSYVNKYADNYFNEVYPVYSSSDVNYNITVTKGPLAGNNYQFYHAMEFQKWKHQNTEVTAVWVRFQKMSNMDLQAKGYQMYLPQFIEKFTNASSTSGEEKFVMLAKDGGRVQLQSKSSPTVFTRFLNMNSSTPWSALFLGESRSIKIYRDGTSLAAGNWNPCQDVLPGNNLSNLQATTAAAGDEEEAEADKEDLLDRIRYLERELESAETELMVSRGVGWDGSCPV
ncbi:putative capsid [Beihai astro-like virus]|uniref:putative capsid n=1 Tax=Beihai astro-like virus TaxID=1922353 RepID=UPI00090B3766|nr:putative capsid [Beihai astro-like virus]APG79033.1 putative capsid [Beihai astro-like virus]